MLKEKVSQSSKNLIVSKVFFIHIFIKLSSCFFSTEININFTVTFKAFNFPVWFFKNILLWLLLPWKAPYSRMDEPPHIASFLQGAYWLETLTQSLKNFSIVFEARFSSKSSETSPVYITILITTYINLCTYNRFFKKMPSNMQQSYYESLTLRWNSFILYFKLPFKPAMFESCLSSIWLLSDY